MTEERPLRPPRPDLDRPDRGRPGLERPDLGRTDRGRPDPRSAEGPRYAPVLFEDEPPPLRARGRGGDGGGRGPRRPRGDGHSDAGLLRILGAIVVLGIVVVALVVPGSPVRLLGRGGAASTAEGVTAKARGTLPAVPGGLTALSKLYDINVPAGVKGPWTIEVALTQPTTDAANLAFYSYESGRWTRIAPVAPVKDGRAVSGDVGSAPGSIAVLRRTGVARTLGLIIEAGQVPDPRALTNATVVAVMAGKPAASGAAGSLDVTAGAVAAAARAAGSAKVYLGVSEDQAAVRSIAASAAHVEAIATLAKREGAAGVFVDYMALPAGQRDAFTGFVRALRDRLQREQLGLLVGVPATGGANGGAYDWGALAASADGLWLHATPESATYHDEMERLLAARREAGTDLAKVSLIVDRRSQERVGTQQRLITLRDALAAASAIDRSAEGGIAAGANVTLRAQNLGDASPVLRWDNTARAVTFSYNAGDGQHSVWIENRYSAAYRLDVATRFGLGGVVVAPARQDEALPDVWATVTTYVQDGAVQLLRPFGPYLAPCWQPASGAIEGPACWTADSVPAARVWRAPAVAGVYNVNLVVSEGTTFVAQQIALRVGGASARPTPAAASTATPTPTATPRPGGAATPAATPTRTPTPGAQPTLPPPPTGGPSTPAPTATPTPAPTASPTSTPAPAPTAAPTPAPTAAPTPTATFPPGQPPGPAGQ